MKARFLFIPYTLVILILGFWFFALSNSTSAVGVTVSSNDTWIDNFDGEPLNTRWSWVRENPTYWSLTANPGFIRLVTRGGLHLTGNNLENILLTSPSAPNFRLITKVTFSPIDNYQAAGLIVYQNDDNYIELTRVYADGGSVRIKKENDGVFSTTYASGVISPTILLRLDKRGDDYYGFFSVDGNDWEFVGQYNQELSSISIGLIGSDGLTVTEDIADFDYFKFIPRTYNNSWVDEFNLTTFNSAWTWLNEDPTHWSLSQKPGFLQITTQEGGMLSGLYHNLLVTDAPISDFQITSSVLITPTETFQGSAIIVYGDDNNYVRMSRRFSGNIGNEVNLRFVSGGVITENFAFSETETTAYLRLTREGNIYTGYYSLDGISYQYVGQFNSELTNPKIGLVSENGPSTTEIQTYYDFFKLENNLYEIFIPLVVR